MSNPVKLFVVEGEDKDYRFINAMVNCFFKGKYESKIINLPAEQNIYMLYKKMVDDNFDSDIVELLRESVDSAAEKLKGISRQSIDEVFLFFDYDIHQDNLAQSVDPNLVTDEMLKAFDNETENGKLYISYPMIEALYDFKEKECETFSGCFLSLDKVSEYKSISGSDNPKSSLHMKLDDWGMILEIFGIRVACLFGCDTVDHEYYKTNVSPQSIFEKEVHIYQNGYVFVLSALPEFLLDYFRKDFWNHFVKLKRKRFSNCFLDELK